MGNALWLLAASLGILAVVLTLAIVIGFGVALGVRLEVFVCALLRRLRDRVVPRPVTLEEIS